MYNHHIEIIRNTYNIDI